MKHREISNPSRQILIRSIVILGGINGFAFVTTHKYNKLIKTGSYSLHFLVDVLKLYTQVNKISNLYFLNKNIINYPNNHNSTKNIIYKI